MEVSLYIRGELKTMKPSVKKGIKIVCWIAAAAFIVGLISTETVFRKYVDKSNESYAIISWIKGNGFFTEAFGKVLSVEIKRPMTEYHAGSFGKSGRFHFLIRGTKSQSEVEVAWERPAGSPSITVNSVATYSEFSSGDVMLAGPLIIAVNK